MPYSRLMLTLAPASLAMCSLFATPAAAELAPRYTTWADFAAVVNQREIPHLLGVVDSVTRTGFGKFRVSGGKCSVDITITRESAKSPSGQPLAGGSHIARVDIGPKYCKP